MKPFKLNFLKLTNKKGFDKNTTHAVNMKYLINFDEFNNKDTIKLIKLINWIHLKDKIDLLNEYPR